MVSAVLRRAGGEGTLKQDFVKQKRKHNPVSSQGLSRTKSIWY